ncbi:MAG: non-homologous end-joining DNA ligase, partial [Pseudomonadota bacterium]
MVRRPRDTGSARFAPQLATAATAPPAGDDWMHEIKLDGYRIGCVIDDGTVTLWSRAGNDWTENFPEIRAAAARLSAKNAVLDGEIAVVLPDGRTNFHALQRALAGGARGGLTYFAFDLLALDGEDTAVLPIERRKERLARLIGAAAPGLPIRYSDHVIGDGPAVFAQACRMGLEGVVSKRRGQPYRPGRSSGWLKVKGEARQEFVIGGFVDRGGAPRGRAAAATAVPGGEVGALLCGTYADDGRLLFAGKVGTG